MADEKNEKKYRGSTAYFLQAQRLTDDVDSDTTEEIPNGFECPITNEWMEDPVIAADGHSYERTAIQEWFVDKGNESPRAYARGISCFELRSLNS